MKYEQGFRRHMRSAAAVALLGEGVSEANTSYPPRVAVQTNFGRLDTVPGMHREAGIRRHVQRWNEMGYAQAVAESVRIQRGWIYVNGTRRDDGTIELGTGGEMRFSPFEALSQRQGTQITWGHILTASVQRLAFWRR
jgi:hypothetical protein